MARLTREKKVLLEDRRKTVLLLKENSYPIKVIAEFVKMSESWVNKVIAENKKFIHSYN